MFLGKKQVENCQTTEPFSCQNQDLQDFRISRIAQPVWKPKTDLYGTTARSSKTSSESFRVFQSKVQKWAPPEKCRKH